MQKTRNILVWLGEMEGKRCVKSCPATYGEIL